MDSKSARSQKFTVSLANLLRARFPFVYISTWEEERVIEAIRHLAGDQELIKTPRKVHTWSATSGMIAEGESQNEETKAPIKALEFIESSDDSALFILKDFHVNFGGSGRPVDHQLVRKIRDIAPLVKRSQRPKNVIFVSPVLNLPVELQKDITILDFALPGFQEVSQLLDELIDANRGSGRITIDLDAGGKERLAKSALGLTLQEAENAFARAMVEDGRLDSSDVDVVLEEKRQIIKKSEILEFVQADANLADVGGLENLKRWLKKRDKSWLDSAQRYGLPAPKGVLITGVPGCGKSLIAKSIGASWHLPLLRLDLGKVYSGLVGSSEENIRRAISTAEALAPAILWIDEIEKGIGGSNSAGDGGTSSRVFGSILTWMQEKTKPVFVVATANNIHALPPELLRKGRFDEIFFVDLPTRSERMDIFRLHLGKRLNDPDVKGSFSIDDRNIGTLSDLSEGFIGAEIEQAVIAGLFEAFHEDRSVVFDDFANAIRSTVPLSVTMSEQIKSIREWANVRAVAATRAEDRSGYARAVESVAPITPDPIGGEDVRSARGGRMVDF